jgi:hypothetical protein
LRFALALLAGAAYVASLAGVDDRLDAAEFAAMRATSISTTLETSPPSMRTLVRRDPFAGAPRRDIVTQSQPGATSTASNDRLTDATEVEVPDIRAEDGATTPAGGDRTRLSVRATIAGSRPVAYLADGVSLEIVRVGDVVENRRVASIDMNGVAFDDGTRLDLGPAEHERSSPAPAPRRRTAATRQRPPHVRTTAPAPIVAPAVAMPSPLVFTPIPLRTVDPRGLAPGTNPTPDALDPTAFPYPYPYPPAAH